MDLTPVTRVEHFLQEIIDNGGGGGGGGTGGGVLIVHENNNILDKTWKEIHDAGFSVHEAADGSILWCTGMWDEDGEYGVSYWTFMMSEPKVFITDNENGYPVVD